MWRIVDNAQNQGLKERPNTSGLLSYLLESHVFSSAGRTGFGESQSSAPWSTAPPFLMRRSHVTIWGSPGTHSTQGDMRRVCCRLFKRGFFDIPEVQERIPLSCLIFFQVLMDYSNQQELMSSHEQDKLKHRTASQEELYVLQNVIELWN